MKHFVLVSAALFLLQDSAEDAVRVVYREGLVVKSEEESWHSTELRSVTAEVDGEELSPEMVELIAAQFPSERTDTRTASTTSFDEVTDERPMRAHRHFDTVWRKKVKGEEEEELTGVLEGRTIELRAGEEEDDEVVAKLADGDDGDPVDKVYLEKHEIVFSMERYLPDHPVKKGDTWSLDESAVKRILGWDRHSAKLFDEEEEEKEEGYRKAMEANAEVRGEVTYEKIEDRDDVRCAVLVIDLSVDVDEAALDPEILGEDGTNPRAAEVSGSISAALSGTERLWFALEDGHPLASEGTMEGEVIVAMSIDSGVSLVITIVTDIAGGRRSQVSVEQED